MMVCHDDHHSIVLNSIGEVKSFMPAVEVLFLGIGLFLAFSIAASKLSVIAGVPALLLFLGLGMLAGSDGPGGLYFDYPWETQSIGVLALAFILFSGGLDTRWREIRPVLRPGLILSTAGVMFTALSVAVFATLVLQLSFLEGLLLGAIISSTDAAAVFAILRGKNVYLKGRLKPLLELESGSNDPMAVFFTIGVIQLLLNPAQSPLSLIPLFVLQMGLGAIMGYVAGRLGLQVINRVRLEYDGLYPVLTVAFVLLTYGGTALIGGNGFLAVYLAGLMLGRSSFIHKRSLTHFHDSLAWLMQIAMFVTLGLQVYPSRLPSVAVDGVLTAIFLIVVARPLSVWVALAFSGFTFREKLFIGWVGLRGAAPIVLATFPLLAGFGQSDTIFHLVFFIVLTSVLLQGTLIMPVARLLGVYDPAGQPPLSPLAYVMNDTSISNDLAELVVSEHSGAVGCQILDLNLPAGALIMLIGRGNDLLVPRGDTRLLAGDRVLLVASAPIRSQLQQFLEATPGSDGAPMLSHLQSSS